MLSVWSCILTGSASVCTIVQLKYLKIGLVCRYVCGVSLFLKKSVKIWKSSSVPHSLNNVEHASFSLNPSIFQTH